MVYKSLNNYNIHYKLVYIGEYFSKYIGEYYNYMDN
jgi:hypothetical protein